MLYYGGVVRKLIGKAAAQHLGIAESTWRAYVARDQAPPADGHDEFYGKPYWLDTTLDRWKDGRPGRGNRTPRNKS